MIANNIEKFGKRIIIMRYSWNTVNWCIVRTIKIRQDVNYGNPYGYIKYAKYANGNNFNGYLSANNGNY